MTRVLSLVLAVAAGLVPGLGPRRTRACEDKQREWSVFAGLAALVSVGAGSVFVFRRRDRDEVAVPSPGGHHPALG